MLNKTQQTTLRNMLQEEDFLLLIDALEDRESILDTALGVEDNDREYARMSNERVRCLVLKSIFESVLQEGEENE